MSEKRKGDRLPKDADPHAEITTIASDLSITQTTAPVNPLRRIREDSGAAPAAIIAIVQRRHPKYDKTLQSKCERTELYGVQLAEDSMKDLRRELTPEEEKKAAWVRQGRHRLTASVSCRLSDEECERFREIARQSGNTMQAYLSTMIRDHLYEHELRDPAKASALQAKYCKTNDLPHFAPSGGRCYRCHQQIYENLKTAEGYISHGISVWEAGHRLVTGCPHCHYSFVE